MRPSYFKPRRFIKRVSPSPRRIRSLNLHRYLGDRIHDQRFWIINRQSISRATAIGLFCAYLPMPLEMLIAALLAIGFRANLPVAILLVWISNPLTWLILYTPPYLLGLAILGETGISLHGITVEMMMDQLLALWIGCLIFGTALGAAGYVLSNVIWRMLVANEWSRRKDYRRSLEEDDGQSPVDEKDRADEGLP